MVESDPEALAILGPTPTSPMGRVGPMEEHQVQRVANLLASRAGLHSMSQHSGLKPPLSSSAPGPIMPPSPPPPPIMPIVRPSSLYASSGFHKGGAVPVSASPRGMAPPSLAGLGGFGGLGGLGPNPSHHSLGDHSGTGSPNYPGTHSPPHHSTQRDRGQGLGGAGASWRPL